MPLLFSFLRSWNGMPFFIVRKMHLLFIHSICTINIIIGASIVSCVNHFHQILLPAPLRSAFLVASCSRNTALGSLDLRSRCFCVRHRFRCCCGHARSVCVPKIQKLEADSLMALQPFTLSFNSTRLRHHHPLQAVLIDPSDAP